MRSRSRLVFAVAMVAHFIHDGFSDVLYVLFPVWAREFHLAYSQVGLIKMLYIGGMALFQIPAGLLAERRGEGGLLGTGTTLTACGFIATAAWAGGFPALAIFLLIAGLGSGVQHPLASSLVSKAYETGARRAALGTYNFLGAPPSPRTAHSGSPQERGGWGIRDSRGFLPFALIAKGSTTAGVGAAVALVFVGGAAGKLVCGLLAERFGLIRTVVITEAATALGIAIIVVVPLSVAVAAMVPMGIALNGTSSALYGTVAEFVIPERRSRGYGLYYTIAISASALAPFIYGVFGDLVGVPRTLALIAGAALITIPLALTLRPAVAAPARAA